MQGQDDCHLGLYLVLEAPSLGSEVAVRFESHRAERSVLVKMLCTKTSLEVTSDQMLLLGCTLNILLPTPQITSLLCVLKHSHPRLL